MSQNNQTLNITKRAIGFFVPSQNMPRLLIMATFLHVLFYLNRNLPSIHSFYRIHNSISLTLYHHILTHFVSHFTFIWIFNIKAFSVVYIVHPFVHPHYFIVIS